MAGRPEGDQPRNRLIQIRVTEAERKALDKKRGGVSISDFIRRLIFGGES